MTTPIGRARWAKAITTTRGMPLAAQGARALQVRPCAAAPRLRHLEYFHVRRFAVG